MLFRSEVNAQEWAKQAMAFKQQADWTAEQERETAVTRDEWRKHASDVIVDAQKARATAGEEEAKLRNALHDAMEQNRVAEELNQTQITAFNELRRADAQCTECDKMEMIAQQFYTTSSEKSTSLHTMECTCRDLATQLHLAHEHHDYTEQAYPLLSSQLPT